MEDIYSVINEVSTTVITLPMIFVDEDKGIFINAINLLYPNMIITGNMKMAQRIKNVTLLGLFWLTGIDPAVRLKLFSGFKAIHVEFVIETLSE